MMAPSSSLLTPSADAPASSTRYQQSSSSNSRHVSVSVQPTPSSSSPAPSKKQRASHQVVSPSQTQNLSGHHSGRNQAQEDSAAPYTDVYSHPAAVAYAAAHPRRTIPKFGPYLLLQTLGEGEFGKVKLGLHSQWGEEVAVKLIRRGNIDTTVRMSKVEREIAVLKTLKHPNIVRLYDVIETDKYIGIIIEYASGGELFDHILAHRYLREKDAAKLFSQLISGVWYIHQKKIVHRDLKLENLLLDRHRNVIITDFGFANRFEHRSDDLMQTSCGSPCYAAPELVISEGLYVGSAVDIWSCGVILYAMLAGYLPFDDDPANPDGDNINLLYKYIVNTPLSFPEYVSDSARDMLGLMLVPDPSKRASLEDVMRHPWLAAYSAPPADPFSSEPTAFGRTVEELEQQALDQHQQKRLAYQRTMKAVIAVPTVSRSQTAPYANGGNSSMSAISPPTSGRGQPEYLYETSNDLISAPPMSAPASAPSSGKERAYNVDDDPFAAPGGYGVPPMSASAMTTLEPVSSSKKAAVAQRNTIQVEYDSSTVPRSASKRDRDGQASDREHQKRSRGRSGSRDHAESPTNSYKTPTKRRPSESSASQPIITSHDAVTASPQKTPTRRAHSRDPPSITLASPPDTPVVFAHNRNGAAMDIDTSDRSVDDKASGNSQNSRGSGKHKRGISAVGNIAKMFGGSNGDVNDAADISGTLLSPSVAENEKEKDEEKASNESSSGKKSRRNTITVMMEPISRTIKNRTKGRSTPTPLSPQEQPSPKMTYSSPISPNSGLDSADIQNGGVGAVPHGLNASTTKARGVMQWFRSRSRARESTGITDSSYTEEPQNTSVASEYRSKNATSSSTVNQQNFTPSAESASPVQTTRRESIKIPKAHRSPSTESSVTPSFVKRFRDSVTVSGVSSGNNGGILRIHHGAVDQSMITTMPPPKVIEQVKNLLVELGIEVQKESEFKYRCIRPKRRKAPSGSTMGSTNGSNLTAFTMAGSAASNGVDKRGLPIPSHGSFTGGSGMLKGLLMRRQSSQMSSGMTSFDDDTPNTSVMSSEIASINEPLYGDNTEDVGDEVRFSVELTRIDRLNDTYSVDIRRLKGNLRSYKFLYESIRQRADLS